MRRRDAPPRPERAGDGGAGLAAGLGPGDWFDRFGRRIQDDRLPKGKAEREALAAQIGADGRRLLAALEELDARPGLAHLPAVRTLRRVWLEQYDAGEPIRWGRPTTCRPRRR